MQETQFHSLREGSIVEIDCKPGWTRLEISSNFAAIVFLGGSRFLSIFSTPSLRVVAHSSWRRGTNDWRVRFGREEEFAARRDSRYRSKKDSGHLAKCYFVSRKESGVVPQQRPVISQSAFSSRLVPFAATLASKRRGIEPRRLLPLSSGRNANGSNLGRAISSIRNWRAR